MASRSWGSWIGDRLSRVTSSGEFVPEIDGLRFIAILAVVAHHLMSMYLVDSGRFGAVDMPADWSRLQDESILVRLAFIGSFGVQLFFVISGFILVLPFARSHLGIRAAPSLRSYYRRRLTRIEPPYAINLLVSFLLIWLRTPGWRAFVPHLIASLLYSHSLVYGEASWINGVAWSLEIEVQFYAMAPLLAMVFAIRDATARRIVLMAAVLGCGVVPEWLIAHVGPPRLFLTVLDSLQYFLAGFLLAELHLARAAQPRATTRVWDAVVALSGAAMLLILASRQMGVLLPFLTVLFYLGMFRGKLSNAVIRCRPVVIAGGMCYTIYLYHLLVIGHLSRRLTRFSSPARPLWLDFPAYALVQSTAIFVVCAGLFVCTERPFMKTWRWSRRWSRAKATVSSPAI